MGAALSPLLMTMLWTLRTAQQPGLAGCHLRCGHPAPRLCRVCSPWWESQADRGWGSGREAPSYPKADLPVGAHLQVEAVGAVPVCPMLLGWGGKACPLLKKGSVRSRLGSACRPSSHAHGAPRERGSSVLSWAGLGTASGRRLRGRVALVCSQEGDFQLGGDQRCK